MAVVSVSHCTRTHHVGPAPCKRFADASDIATTRDWVATHTHAAHRRRAFACMVQASHAIERCLAAPRATPVILLTLLASLWAAGWETQAHPDPECRTLIALANAIRGLQTTRQPTASGLGQKLLPMELAIFFGAPTLRACGARVRRGDAAAPRLCRRPSPARGDAYPWPAGGMALALA